MLEGIMMSTTCGGANGSLSARLGFVVCCPCDKRQKRREDWAPGITIIFHLSVFEAIISA
jgi:hypothetical protein